jgi:putative tryptophan/tyrosine transport system substrate-binding protein
MNRRASVLALVALGASPLACFAQQPEKIFRIGYLDAGSASKRADRIESVRAGLRELGYVEGKNMVFEFRWAEGKYERLPSLAQELARTKVDVLVAVGTPCTMAAKQATSAIPIVMVSASDPIASGLVTSLARPAGNVTGTAILEPELMSKRFELIFEISPRAKQVAMLVNESNPAHAAVFKAMEVAAKSRKIVLQKSAVKNLDEVKSAFATMAKGASAVVVPVDTMFSSNYAVIAILAETHRVPSFGDAAFAAVGGLIGFGVRPGEYFRHSATYIDKIFKGAMPSELPVEQPTKFELVVNLKAAKVLGVKVPQSILDRADRVIE